MADALSPSQAQPEINELINRVLEGHHDEFKGIVRRYQTKVYVMALENTQSPEAAADLCQDIFLKIYENLRRFDQTGSFTNWILRIATRCVSESPRPARKPAPSSEPFDVSLLESNRRQQVLKVFHSLDDETKTAVWLYYFFDRSCDQIAEILEIPVAQVKARLFRARRIMGRDLDKTGVHPGS